MSIWLLTLGLIIGGFILVLVEIFLIPGFNIFGIFGFIAIVAGIVTAYSSLEIWYAHAILLLSLIGSVVLVRIVIHSKTWKKIILDTESSQKDGYEVRNRDFDKLLNTSGIAYTMLRPAGTAIFNGKKYDVITEGSFIDRDSKINVVKVEGNRIIVRQA